MRQNARCFGSQLICGNCLIGWILSIVVFLETVILFVYVVLRIHTVF